MADNQVTLEINVDAKDAQKAIDQFGASAVKSVKSAEKSFNSFGGSLKGLGAGIMSALGPLATLATVYKSISEANEAEKANRALAISIASTGEYSKEAVAALSDFSDELGNLIGVDDDVIKSQLSLAKSFGISNEQAKDLVTAASNLSAVTGVDLETAVRQLGGTYDGTVGKIGNLGGEFRALTKEQLENGDAIDIINKKYEGAGAILGDTFEGQLNRVKNSFNDAFKAIGTEIINDPNILSGLKVVTDSLKAFAPLAASAARGLISLFKIFGTGLGVVTSSVTSVASSLASLFGKDEWAKDLDKLTASSYDFIEALNKEESQTNAIAESQSKFDSQMNKVSKSYDKNSKNAEKNAKVLEELKKSYEEVSKSLQTAGFNDLQVVAKTAGDRFTIVDKALKKGIISEEKASEDRKAILEEYNKAYKKSTDEQIEIEKKKADEIRAYAEGLTRDPIKIFLDISSGARDVYEVIDNFKDAFKGAAFAGVVGDISKNLAASAAGILNAALDGRQGATKLLGSIAGSFADKVIPGIGGAVSEIFGKLAAGKEQAKAFVKEFISSIPEIIKGVIEALPGILDAIIEVIGRPSFWLDVFKAVFSFYKAQFAGFIYQTLYESAFKGISAGFASASEKAGDFFSNIFSSIGDHFTNIFSNAGPQFAESIRGLFNNIGGPFGEALKKATEPLLQGINGLKSAFQPLIDAITSAADAIKSATGQKGGSGLIAEGAQNVGDVLTGKKKIFSKGGMVYASNGYFNPVGTDTVPAMLTPGELVVPRDMVGSLGQFLSNTDSGKNEAILMAILQAVQQPISVQSEVKVNQSAFADIMLQLNRQNARVVA